MTGSKQKQYPLTKSILARKFIFYILLFSSIITLIGTSIQLYLDYNKDKNSIQSTLTQVETTHLQSIVNSLWVYDQEQINVQLQEILSLPDIQYIAISLDGEEGISVGTRKSTQIISQEYPLIYSFRNQDVSLGSLQIEATLDNAFQRLRSRVFVILLTQGIKTFLVSFFIFFIFYLLVGRYLRTMADFARRIDLETIDTSLQLDLSKRGQPDELDQVVSSLNYMQARIRNDISKREQAEEVLRQYEHIVSSSTDMLALLDKRFTYLAANESYFEAFKFTSEQLIGKTVITVFGEEFFNTVIKPYAVRCLGGKEVSYQDWFDFPKHGQRYMDITYYPYFSEDKKIIGFVVCGRNFTERKQVADDLQASNQQLKISERHLRVKNNLSEIFLLISDDKMYHEVLKIVLKEMESEFGVFGYIDEEGALVIPSMTTHIRDKCDVQEKKIVFPRDQWGCGSWPRAINEMKPNFTNEPSSLIPEGHIHFTKHISLPITYQGQVIGLFQVANKTTDYTEVDVKFLETIGAAVAPILNARLQRDLLGKKRNLAEKEIRKLNNELEQRVAVRTAQLQESNKELEAFSYSVSHDLRAPLRAIGGFSQMLVDDYADKLDADGQHRLDVVRDSAEQMGELIDGLLALSRLGRTEMRHGNINMENLVKEVFEKLQDAEPTSAKLIVKALPAAHCDRLLLHTVFTNLLSNAVKFAKPGRATTIEVAGSVEENEIVCSVKDNGVGFDMKYVDKIFQVFQRLHRAEEFEGTGIGLALVQRIIHRSGGRVWAEGEVDKGATLYFTLPRQEDVGNE
jgi:PAS domain S-box-containing protein